LSLIGVSTLDGGSMTKTKETVDHLFFSQPGINREEPVATEICRGVCRLLEAYGLAGLAELPLPNNRRADVVALSGTGEIWIIEIKSSIEDFRSDQKWHEYRDFCDRLFFAVKPEFPNEILPPKTGLILADRYGGEVIRTAPEFRLAGAHRKSMTLRFARAAAARLQSTLDPPSPI
jgi:hypothetical protein